MDLFTEDEDGLPKINLELKTIVCFRKLIERDKSSKGDADGRKKRFSTLEAAYVFWEGKFNSPYIQEFPDSVTRLKHIRKEAGLPDNWQPDEVVLECLDWFKNSQITKSMRLLESMEKMIDGFRDYFDNVDLTETIKDGKDKGNLKHDASKVMKNAKDVPELVIAVKEMKTIVSQEIDEKVTGKAGRVVSMFEQKRKN